jgi:hypothetical protein
LNNCLQNISEKSATSIKVALFFVSQKEGKSAHFIPKLPPLNDFGVRKGKKWVNASKKQMNASIFFNRPKAHKQWFCKINR